jgi:hypothetical protein
MAGLRINGRTFISSKLKADIRSKLKAESEKKLKAQGSRLKAESNTNSLRLKVLKKVGNLTYVLGNIMIFLVNLLDL